MATNRRSSQHFTFNYCLACKNGCINGLKDSIELPCSISTCHTDLDIPHNDCKSHVDVYSIYPITGWLIDENSTSPKWRFTNDSRRKILRALARR